MELVEALLCEEFGLAPRPGSLEDQDFAQLARYAELRGIYRVLSRLQNEGMKALGPDEKRVAREILDLELLENRSANTR